MEKDTAEADEQSPDESHELRAEETIRTRVLDELRDREPRSYRTNVDGFPVLVKLATGDTSVHVTQRNYQCAKTVYAYSETKNYCQQLEVRVPIEDLMEVDSYQYSCVIVFTHPEHLVLPSEKRYSAFLSMSMGRRASRTPRFGDGMKATSTTLYSPTRSS